MKTNRNLLLWKKNTLYLFYIIFAFNTILGWQVSESSAQDWATCVKPVDIPDEIDVVILNQESQEKTITNETDDDWFKYYFTNEEDDTNPDPSDTNGEDHGINIDEDEDVYIPEDLSWEVYDRNGICVSRGKSGDRFGPSLETLTPPPGADPLPSDIYFIRIIWDPDPEDVIEFEDGDGRFTYSLTLNGTAVPRVDGFIKDAFSGEELKGVKVTNNETQIDIDSDGDGYYALDTPDGNNPLDYDRDGYKPLIINDFVVKKNDIFPQDVILCPNDVVLTATPTLGDAPLTVTFDLPDVTNPEVSAVYDWDFGDGTSSDSPDPVSYTYSDSGTYKVNVTVSLTLPTSAFVTKEVECTVTSSVDVIVEEDPSSPQDWVTCIKPVNIPNEIDVVKLNDEPIEKTLINETDDDWFKYYFTNEEDDTNPDPDDKNGEDHSINMGAGEIPPFEKNFFKVDNRFFNEFDLSWEVYDRNGICVARGKSGERFGPSLETLTPPPGADPLPSDIYYIRIVWDPEDEIDFEEGTYSLTVNGTAVPRVDGFIKDAFSGKELKDVKVKNNETKIEFDSEGDGYYALDTPDGNNPLDYNLDGYNPLIINDFVVKKNDIFPQDVILCPKDVVLTATPSSGDAPLEVTFDLPDVNNPVVSAVYDWDFGDGMSSDSPDPAPITYFLPGTKNVNVTVTVTLPKSDFVTKKIECTVESSVDVVVGGDSSHAEIIGAWSSGIYYRDVATSKYTRMEPDPPTGDIAAGDFTGDGIADVAAIYDSGLWYIDGVSLDWIKVPGTAPNRVTAGDVTGDGRAEIIGAWSSGIWYRDVAESKYTRMDSDPPTGDIAAGDFTGDGIADVAAIYGRRLWYIDGASLDWIKVPGSAPDSLTAGDVTGDKRAEIIGAWSSGIYYRDVAASKYTRMDSDPPTGDIAAGDFTGDGIADVAAIYGRRLWYIDGASLDWIKVPGSAPDSLTAGDVTGN